MGTSRGAISTVGLPVWLITFSLCVPVLSCGDPAGPGEALVDTAPVKEWRYDLVSVPDVEAVWGSGSGVVVVVGEAGQVISSSGAEWSDISPDEFGGRLVSVWGTPAGELFAVARDNYLLHYDGSAWDIRRAPVGGDTQFYDVWGSSPENVFAVGWGGRIFHYDGSGWNRMADATWSTLTGVWGAAGDDVFAVGTSAILHYDGSAWTSMDAPLPARGLNAVWGTASDTVYAVGGNGAVLRYDGADWTGVDVGTDGYFADVWGSAATDVYVVGSVPGTGFNPSGVIHPLRRVELDDDRRASGALRGLGQWPG